MDHWQYFNFPEIMREARLRLAEAKASSAAAITADMRTLEYWVAWCAHANAAACLSDGQYQTMEK